MIYSPTSSSIQRFLTSRQDVVERSFGPVSVPEAVQLICEYSHDRSAAEWKKEMHTQLNSLNTYARSGIVTLAMMHGAALLTYGRVRCMAGTFLKCEPTNDLEERNLRTVIHEFAQNQDDNPRI